MVKERPLVFFKVIMLDINMPIMDGFEACELIDKHLESNYKTLIYALTADQNPQIIDKISKYPFTRLYQSISESDIEEIVKKL
jgi:CheY-like chemotaxis protein